MKKIFYSIIAAAGIMVTATGCEKYLDVNENPNGPQSVSPNLYLASMESNLALGVQYDSRFLGKYVQNFVSNSAGDTWDRHGYQAASDNSGQQWRSVYWKMGINLQDMINLSLAQERWDLAGIGYALKAWGWQSLTDYHGEIIIKQAFDPKRDVFDYDTQEFAYSEVRRLCDSAMVLLNRTDGAISADYAAKGDLMYKGDRSKWIKFVNGLLALNAHHLSNKSSYDPAKVIEYVDKALASNADDASVPFNGKVNDDTNFFGPLRNNLGTFRQSNFILSLLNGSVFGGVTDPRLALMLSSSPDGAYYGLNPNAGYGTLTTNQRPNTLWGTAAATTVGAGKYLFNNDVRFPLMTYSQLQFIKAEAAFLKNDKATALDAYKKGIDSHIDFVNQYTSVAANQIKAADKSTFLGKTAIVPTDANSLTLKMILLQKYIAQFGWGFTETWCDLRRYHYDSNVFTGFTLPASLFPDNNAKPAYRFRPRYNSEYVWNAAALKVFGGLDLDYHTKEMWFSQQ
ncbi:SusD/RagB family nutrient-binding outer membrane lipoprotein [Solitalea lacus]|uniref:SusD/RagB family nutrient-binding outer membrane lipoprotein n=1 Tax=Solitalea lacus TaxID=2911172 RepID=UPI001EDC3003|nr:SusD/RagB family nutrient-binding outer membrane lipoprotein [Solitalea lacus]UKJ07253.1 SusD/RagB family nutrient-binding outer membrane lipoprotein [Solitalea lacus]